VEGRGETIPIKEWGGRTEAKGFYYHCILGGWGGGDAATFLPTGFSISGPHWCNERESKSEKKPQIHANT